MWQFSIQNLLIIMVFICLGLGVYTQSGPQPLFHYLLLLCLVGPWFVHLFCECLPIRSRGTRNAIGNFLLLVLFTAGVAAVGSLFDETLMMLAGLVALIAWTPQYMVFFVLSKSAID